MQINVVYDASVDQNAYPSLNAPAGFKTAINYVVNLFYNLFTNNVPSTIDDGWGEVGAPPANPGGTPIPPNAAAASFSTAGQSVTYAKIAIALVGNPNESASQQTAYNNLPLTDPFNGNPFALTIANEEALAPNDPTHSLNSSFAGVAGYIGFDST